MDKVNSAGYKHLDRDNDDPIVSLLDKVCFVCPKGAGNNFSGRLISIRGSELWFESRGGLRWMISRENIRKINEMRPKEA